MGHSLQWPAELGSDSSSEFKGYESPETLHRFGLAWRQPKSCLYSHLAGKMNQYPGCGIDAPPGSRTFQPRFEALAFRQPSSSGCSGVKSRLF